jgi:hypothetical protein
MAVRANEIAFSDLRQNGRDAEPAHLAHGLFLDPANVIEIHAEGRVSFAAIGANATDFQAVYERTARIFCTTIVVSLGLRLHLDLM